MVSLVHPTTTRIFLTKVTTINYYNTFVIILLLGHLSQYARVYGLLLCITIFESTCIKFFPWLVTDFCTRSGGYPTPFLFRICGYGKMVQSLVSTLVQLVILTETNIDSSQCGIIIIVAISSSIIVLVMTSFEIIFQSSSLSTVSNTNNNRNSNSTTIDAETELSTRGHRLSVISSANKFFTDSNISATINPMVKEEG